jgi:TRAP-type uncharacterized transport system substrate-binding protein
MIVNPNTTRGATMLQIAMGLVDDRANQPVTIELGRGEGLRLASNSTSSAIREVIAKKADVAIVNPSAALLQAYRGLPPFSSPQAVRLLAVIPSQDQFLFAAHRSAGLEYVEDIAKQRKPIRLSLRGARDHSLHDILAAVMAEAGFTTADIETWGGKLIYEGPVPRADSRRFQLCVAGEIDALFDEGAHTWIGNAIAQGLDLLSLKEETVQRLEAKGYRRAWLRANDQPGQKKDILTVDFSGWAIFVHAELPDSKAHAMCQALDQRRDQIPWQEERVLPVETMCKDTPAGPHQIPLHPGAEKYWKERGYI